MSPRAATCRRLSPDQPTWFENQAERLLSQTRVVVYSGSMTITVNLNAAERTALMRPLNGQGGFQAFGRSLQGKLQANGDIELTDAQLGRILRHISYRPGGFEDRLEAAFGRSLRAML